MLNKINILGVDITNETAEDILEYIQLKLKEKTKFFIVTPNPEILVYATRHESYKKILNQARISLPDGTGLFLASIFMLKPFKQRIPGIDFMEKICELPVSIGLLGGRPEIAQRVAERLLKKYPNIDIVFVGEEWNGLANGKWQMANGAHKKQSAISNKPSAEIDILFVAFGHPKQEEWIVANLDKIPIKAAMGVGGAFDYISGNVTRAPLLIRLIGFEWLYRLIRQPWRWRRQLALLEFVKLILRERFGSAK